MMLINTDRHRDQLTGNSLIQFARWKGVFYRRAGKLLCENPYKNGELRDAWQDGWWGEMNRQVQDAKTPH